MQQVHPRIILYACLVSIGGFVFGFDAAVIGGAIGYVREQYALAPWQIGLVVSAPTLAAIVASFTIGIVSDIFGRKKVLIFLAGLYLVSALVSASAWGFWSLVIARAVGGYAFGALTQAPVYIAEISPAHSRGRLVAINQMAIVIGISAAYFSNLAIQMNAENITLLTSEPWRLMLGIEAVPAAIWLIGLFLVPETPRWLATKSRWGEAQATFRQLGFDEEDAQSMAACIKEDVGEKHTPFSDRLKSLTTGPALYAIMIGLIIAIVQQITGINTVFFYAPIIFEQSGVGTNGAFTQAVFVGLINIAFTIVAMLLIDKLGRRALMLIGLTGVTISMSIVSWGFSSATYSMSADDIATLEQTAPATLLAPLQDQSFESDIAFKTAVADIIGDEALKSNESAILAAGMKGNSGLILFGILFFVASFAMSLGPVMWVYLAEIFPNQSRGIAISLVTVFNSGASWLVQFLFPIQLATGGISGVFSGYALFAMIGLVLVAWLMPETKGLSLEKIGQTMKPQLFTRKG